MDQPNQASPAYLLLAANAAAFPYVRCPPGQHQFTRAQAMSQMRK
jgi:hypothetical protein